MVTPSNKKKTIHFAGITSPLLRTVGKILRSLHLKSLLYNLVITLSQEKALHQLRKIAQYSSYTPEKTKQGKKIIVHSVHGTFLEAIYKEGGIAKALQLRGHIIKMLLCGRALTACPGVFTNKTPPNKWMCRNCIYFSKNFLKITDLPHAHYFDYININDINKIKRMVSKMSINKCKTLIYKDVRAGFHAQSSVIRFFEGENSEDSKYKYDDILRLHVQNGIIATNVAERIMKIEKPDIILTSHGCYSSWGCFSEYFINNDIRVVTWGSGSRANTLVLDLDKLGCAFDRYNLEILKEKKLGKEEKQDLMEFLNKRTVGDKEGGDTSIFGFEQHNKEFLENKFRFNQYKRTYAMFPNLPWDVDLTTAHVVFRDVYDWITYTIQLFRDRPKFQLLVKIHPIEHQRSEKTTYDYILKEFKNLPENITIIPPNTKISAYSLFPFLDVGIIYNGTLGMELALNNIPAIIAGKIHYRNRGFTYDVHSKEEYKTLLFDTVFKELPQEKRELLHNFAYFYFCKTFIPFNILYYKNFLNHGWKIQSFDDFTERKNYYLDCICNYIINNTIYQDW